MWADGWREIRLPWNFRRTRYCSEREQRRRRGTRGGTREKNRGRGRTTGHIGNLPGELHHSGYHSTPETLAVPNCSLIPTGRYIVWVSASASGGISYSAVTHVARPCLPPPPHVGLGGDQWDRQKRRSFCEIYARRTYLETRSRERFRDHPLGKYHGRTWDIEAISVLSFGPIVSEFN